MTAEVEEELEHYIKSEGQKWMSLNNPDRYKDSRLKEQAMALVVPGHLKYIFRM